MSHHARPVPDEVPARRARRSATNIAEVQDRTLSHFAGGGCVQWRERRYRPAVGRWAVQQIDRSTGVLPRTIQYVPGSEVLNAVTDMQPSAYWTGEFDKVNEFSQPDHWTLARTPPPVRCVGGGLDHRLQHRDSRPAGPGGARHLDHPAARQPAGASWWIGGRVPGGFRVGFGMFVAIGVLVATTWSKAGVSPAITRAIRSGLAVDCARARSWLICSARPIALG